MIESASFECNILCNAAHYRTFLGFRSLLPQSDFPPSITEVGSGAMKATTGVVEYWYLAIGDAVDFDKFCDRRIVCPRDAVESPWRA